MYCAQCILVMQINAESQPPRFAPFPAQLPRSWLPIRCSKAPDSMSSLRRSASDFFRIKAFVDGLRNWYRSAAFDTKKVHYNVKWNRVPWVRRPAKLFVTPWTAALQAPLSMEFSRQEYWSGLPFPTPGNLPSPGTETASPESPALQVDFLPLSHLGRPSDMHIMYLKLN